MVVAHNGSEFLPRTLAALAGQTRPADMAIGVDTGSHDNSAALLERALGPGNVTGVGGGQARMGGAVSARVFAQAPWDGES
ncbi:MAG: hypothetical protein QOH40_2844, partial [Arthrobacter pascens]|nr:hypothetical protein [Arthrobacter pascens]